MMHWLHCKMQSIVLAGHLVENWPLDNKSLYNYVPGHFEHMTANIYTNRWNHQQCCKNTNMKMIFSPLFKCPVTIRTWNLSAYKRLLIALPTFELDNLNWVHGQKYEPPHDKTNKVSVCPAKTQISLGICPVWSESLLCAQWVAKDPRFLHADSEYSDQTGRMPRLIWVFTGCTHTLLVLSCCGSFYIHICHGYLQRFIQQVFHIRSKSHILICFPLKQRDFSMK